MAVAARAGPPAAARFRRAWIFLSLAYLAYGLAEVPSAVLEITHATGPIAYLCTTLYLSFYPLFLVGTLQLPPLPLPRSDRMALALDMGIVMLGAIFLIWSLIVMPAMARSLPDRLALVETIALPVAGLGVLWSLLTLLFRRLARPAAVTGRLLAVTAALMIVTDALYSYHLLNPSNELWSVLGLGWACGHLTAGLAAVRCIAGIDRDLPRAAAGPREARRASLASVYLAYSSIVAVVLVLVGMHLRWLSVFGALTVTGMLVLGVVRKAVGLSDNERLKLDLRTARDGLEVRVRERTAELARANDELLHEVQERRKAEDRIRQQLDRLGALRAIDNAISSSLDLRVTLDVFLDNVLDQLHVDSAEVLLLDPLSTSLVTAASRDRDGGGPGAAGSRRLPLGEGLAGSAALERRTTTSRDPSAVAAPGGPAGRPGAGDGPSAWAVPLLAKGQVRGVLEVHCPGSFRPDSEWLDFLNALAGQGAIAIDNMSLFESIQRSNVDLTLAYESTLEGWSRALDLRDHETQGHTLRVTETTVELARACGMSDGELVHARRGALLHDIGKMAIPDAILLKPGPLDEDEWAVMRQHPTHAFHLLSPVAYLRPALDIPYCHHEHWDGSGYPRGLKGIEIPLAARVFSVVDSWDALGSDRPYRRGLPPDQVIAHIRASSGALFDPEVVSRFVARRCTH